MRAAVSLVIALAACRASRVAPPATPSGAWFISISVEQSTLSPQAVGKRVTGTFHLQGKNAALTDLPPGSFGYFGPFSIDFRPIGGWLIGTSDTTAPRSICPNTLIVAAATAGWDDSVHVILNPCTDHGQVVFDGKWRGREVVGRWYESRSGGSSGMFTLRRPPP